MKQVLEIVGFEPETNELITNTVYEWDPSTDRFVFKGHSFLFDKIMEVRRLLPRGDGGGVPAADVGHPIPRREQDQRLPRALEDDRGTTTRTPTRGRWQPIQAARPPRPRRPPREDAGPPHSCGPSRCARATEGAGPRSE